MPTTNKKQIATNELINASFILGAYKTFLVLPTQPLQVIMRHQQASLHNGKVLSVLPAARDIYKSGKRSSFFKGVLPAMGKEGFKNGTYKGALFKGAPKLVKNYFDYDALKHLSAKSQHATIAFLSAFIASGADTVLGGFFERYATYLATSQTELSNAKFSTELKAKKSLSQKISFIYKGSTPSFVKTGISCVALFGLGGPIQQKIHQFYGIQAGQNIPLYVAALCAFSTGTVVAALSSPFDIAKTLAQMPGSKDKQPVLKTLQNNIKRFGVAGAFAGFKIKVLMTSVGWAAVSLATQQSSRAPEEYTFRFCK